MENSLKEHIEKPETSYNSTDFMVSKLSGRKWEFYKAKEIYTNLTEEDNSKNVCLVASRVTAEDMVENNYLRIKKMISGVIKENIISSIDDIIKICKQMGYEDFELSLEELLYILNKPVSLAGKELEQEFDEGGKSSAVLQQFYKDFTEEEWQGVFIKCRCLYNIKDMRVSSFQRFIYKNREKISLIKEIRDLKKKQKD